MPSTPRTSLCWRTSCAARPSSADRPLRWGPPTVLVNSAHQAFSSVTFDDEQAGFLAGLRTAGAEAPRQGAVAGFDDGPLAEGLGLTTVRQAFAESGRHAAELLNSLIRSPGHAVSRPLPTPELRVRETTGG